MSPCPIVSRGNWKRFARPESPPSGRRSAIWTRRGGRDSSTECLSAPGRSRSAEGAASYRALLEAFEARHGVDREVRLAAARRLARAGRLVSAARIPSRRGVRPIHAGARVAVVSPEPTPYRAPLFDRISERLDLTVIYAAKTVAARAWTVEPKHRSVFLRGIDLPGARRVLRHAYPLTPGIFRALHDARPDVVVVSGWSTFASQAAIAWCRARSVPYVLLVESHDLGPRAKWRRAVKTALVPRVVRGAGSVLVVGTLARDSVVARGAEADRVRVFANTVDVVAWERRARELADRRDDLRAALRIPATGVAILSVGRLVPEKGIDSLIRAVREAKDPRISLVVAGAGPEERRLAHLADNR